MADSIDKFEDFMAAIGSEMPDMSAIKDAILKHPEWLSDESKLKQFFPERSPEHNGYVSLGLEDTKGLATVLLAAAELNKETDDAGNKKFSDEQLDKIKNFKNPDTNETASECIDRNIDIAQRKLSKSYVQRNQGLTDKLEQNSAAMSSQRRLLESAGMISSRTGDGNEAPAPLTVGANEDVEIGGAVNTQTPVTVNAAPQPAPNEELNEAIGEEPGEEDKGHTPIEFAKVKQGDIIEYMFEEWFLASINWLGEKLYNGLDRIIEGYDAKPSHTASSQPRRAAPAPAPATPAPTPAPTTPTPTPTTARDYDGLPTFKGPIPFMDTRTGFPHVLVQQYIQESERINNLRLQTILQNLGKPAKDWKMPQGVNLSMEFRQKVANMKPEQVKSLFAQATKPTMTAIMALASRAATLQYLQEHKDEKIDFNNRAVQEDIKQRADGWMKTMTEQAKQNQNNPDFLLNMNKTMDKMEDHLTEFYNAKKSKAREAAAEKVDAFNFTKELFQGKEPVGLVEEASRQVIASPEELARIQTESASVEQAKRENQERKAAYKEKSEEILHPATERTSSHTTERRSANETGRQSSGNKGKQSSQKQTGTKTTNTGGKGASRGGDVPFDGKKKGGFSLGL